MELLNRGPKDQPVNLRLSRKQKDLIDQAAAAAGKSRTEFMVEAAYREAENVLIDRVIYPLDSDVFDTFRRMLEEPVGPTEDLRETLRTSSPWDN